MFDNLNWWEIAVLGLLALFIFGPERLPKVINDGMKMVKTLRQMALGATADLRSELGTDMELEDLHPKNFVRKHLLSDDDQNTLVRPLQDAFKGIESETTEMKSVFRPSAAPGYAEDGSGKKVSTTKSSSPSLSKEAAGGSTASAAAKSHHFDDDAT